MASETPKLYIVSELQYANTTWYTQVLSGMNKESSRKGIKLVHKAETELPLLPPDTIVAVLGSSKPFITKILRLCTDHSLRPIVAGCEISMSYIPVSFVAINRLYAMSSMVEALVTCGAKRVALLGVNPAYQTDVHKCEGWEYAVKSYDAGNPETDIYYSNRGLPSCMNDFWENVHLYDAVVCSNDYYAAYICSHAEAHGIHIPEDLMVAGFGNTLLGQYTNPPLTTVSLNLFSVGEQVIFLYRILAKDPDLYSSTSTLKSSIVFRGSTVPLPHSEDDAPLHLHPLSLTISENVPDSELSVDFDSVSEQGLKQLYSLEATIEKLDDTNVQLIRGLLNNVSYAQLAEDLFLSDTAFKYRLQKIFASTGCGSREELVGLFRKYSPLFSEEIKK